MALLAPMNPSFSTLTSLRPYNQSRIVACRIYDEWRRRSTIIRSTRSMLPKRCAAAAICSYNIAVMVHRWNCAEIIEYAIPDICHLIDGYISNTYLHGFRFNAQLLNGFDSLFLWLMYWNNNFEWDEVTGLISLFGQDFVPFPQLLNSILLKWKCFIHGGSYANFIAPRVHPPTFPVGVARGLAHDPRIPAFASVGSLRSNLVGVDNNTPPYARRVPLTGALNDPPIPTIASDGVDINARPIPPVATVCSTTLNLADVEDINAPPASTPNPTSSSLDSNLVGGYDINTPPVPPTAVRPPAAARDGSYSDCIFYSMFLVFFAMLLGIAYIDMDLGKFALRVLMFMSIAHYAYTKLELQDATFETSEDVPTVKVKFRRRDAN